MKLTELKKLKNKLSKLMVPDWNVTIAFASLDMELANVQPRPDERHAHIEISDKLDDIEIPAVVAHELSHLVIFEFETMVMDIINQLPPDILKYVDSLMHHLHERAVENIGQSVLRCLEIKSKSKAPGEKK